MIASLLAATLVYGATPVAYAAPEDSAETQAAPEDGAAEAPTEPAGDAGAEAPATEPAPEPAPAPEPEPEPETSPDDERAAQAFREGSDAYELGKFEEAAGKFGEAWELSHKPQLLYNLGQAHWKWFSVDPDIDHLRKARLFFTNYDKRMRLSEGYDEKEIAGYLAEIEKQIAEEEKRIEEANRPVIIQSAALTEEEVQREQRRRTTRALNISGNVLIVAGSLSFGLGLGGLASRAVFGAVLDNTSGSDDARTNLATAEEDQRRRDGYLTSGQIAFGGLIAAAVILPVGITLRVIGARRGKVDAAEAGEEDDKGRKKKSRGKKRARVEPSATGIRVVF